MDLTPNMFEARLGLAKQSTGPAPSDRHPNGEVTGELETLKQLVTHLETRFSILAERIAPVCEAEVGEHKGSEVTWPNTTSVVGDEIQMKSRRLHVLADAVERLTARVRI